MSSAPGKKQTTPFPPSVESARELLLQQLGKLLTIEETLARLVLPKLKLELSEEGLRSAVSAHLEETREHVERVRAAFEQLGEQPAGQPAKGLDGLHEERSSDVGPVAPALRPGLDAAAAMGVEHYEINAYEAAIRLGETLGLDEVSDLLRTTLHEEVDALEQLAGEADRLARQAVEQPTVR